VLAIACGLATRSLWYVPLLAFLGAMGAQCAVYAIATQRGRTPVATLLLAGVALNAGIITAAFGAPFFLYLLLTRARDAAVR
jgi:iron complex transport system permease protein